MRVKDIREVFGDYKKSSLLLSTISCDWKCEKEGLTPTGTCQNCGSVAMETIEVDNKEVVKMFNNNNMVDAIIFAGLEPMLQIDEVLEFVELFRKTNSEEVIIFTGYNLEEVQESISKLVKFKNVIVKFGRYIANSKPRYDEVLGIELASENQYAVKIS